MLKALRRWLTDDTPQVTNTTFLSFDNTYEWLRQSFAQVSEDSTSRRRPPYIWGVLQGAALARVLQYQHVSVIEFGVAGGAGLLSLERTAELVEQIVDIKIDVHGFDSGQGLPIFKDYRDMSHLWGEGFFPMDEEKLRARLRRAQLHIGLIETTIPAFLGAALAPVAFISFDLDLYTSTRHALRILRAEPARLLPRIPCFFDDIMGYYGNAFAGERLAITEFNAEQSARNLGHQHGLEFFVTSDHRHHMWPQMMYFAHITEHHLYNAPSILYRGSKIDIDDSVGFSRS